MNNNCITFIKYIFVVSLLYFQTAGAQSVYVGAFGNVNLSYLRNSNPYKYNMGYPRQRVYHLGGQAGIKLGAIPLKSDFSPVFEFSAAYTYRHFSEQYTYNGNDVKHFYDFLKTGKISHDAEFGFNVGLKWKGLYFLTGPIIEKFLKGSVQFNFEAANEYNSDYYELGKGMSDYNGVRYYWNFELGYNIKVYKGLFITPNLNYVLGIKPLNTVDAGYFSTAGYLCHFSLGANISYHISLKRKWVK